MTNVIDFPSKEHNHDHEQERIDRVVECITKIAEAMGDGDEYCFHIQIDAFLSIIAHIYQNVDRQNKKWIVHHVKEAIKASGYRPKR